jgi:prepilin-type processing-associated H-X9-DG protein
MKENTQIWCGVIVLGGVGSGYRNWPPVTIAKVPDGLSKTIAIMEKAVWSQFYQTDGSGAEWWDEAGWPRPAFMFPSVRSLDWPLFADGDQNITSVNYPAGNTTYQSSFRTSSALPASGTMANEQGFGSAHTGIMNALFADGSVHSISLTIDGGITSLNWSNLAGLGVLARLGIRDDGQTIDENQIQ